VGHHRKMRFVLPALGVVLVLVGAVWTLQGSNLLGGSFMSGSRLWLVIGLAALVAGIWLVMRAARTRRS
jgi:FtsH-binding integral membrane protein